MPSKLLKVGYLVSVLSVNFNIVLRSVKVFEPTDTQFGVNVLILSVPFAFHALEG